MTVREAIEARVSVKEYTGEPVPRERIEEILDLANLAPNHRMTQPLAYRVMGDGAKTAYAEALALRKTRKMEDPDTARAVTERVVARTTAVPAMVAVLMNEAEDPEVREEDYATAFMAIQNLSLAAVESGLGTHIKTGAVLGEPSLRTALEAGDEQRIVAIVFLGGPAELPHAKPRVDARERTLWLD